MATRERRANAGNKMRKLLQQEVEEMQSKTEALDDDELDLLFREEAEDEDFDGAESAGSDGGGEDGEVVDKDEEHNGSQEEVDNDLLVSESDEEVSDQDDESNENELQRQESLQRKRKRKTKPPIIQRKAPKPAGATSPAEVTKKKATYEVLKAESLLVSDRRTSKRSHVVANKLEVYEKLSLAEEKRKIIQERLKKHKEKQNEKALTQEDRLRMSLETEKMNVQSLDKYKEQEIYKKQTRLAIQQRQKMKFKVGEPIISEITTSWIVTPIMEYEDKLYWDEQLRKREKKRKKYPRRQSKKKGPGRGSKEIKEEAQHEEEKVEMKEEKGKDEAVDLKDAKDHITEGPGALQPKDATTDQVAVNADLAVEKEEGQSQDTNLSSDPPSNPTSGANVESAVAKTESLERSTSPDKAVGFDKTFAEGQGTKSDETTRMDQSSTSSKDTENIDGKKTHTTPLPGNIQNSHDTSGSLIDQKQAVDKETAGEKLKTCDGAPKVEGQVNSAEKVHVSLAETGAPIPNLNSTASPKPEQASSLVTPELTDDNFTEEELIFEGPPQEVSKNFVTIHNFGMDSCNVDFRASLFGPQWQASQNQRSMDVENICKISMPDNSNQISESSPVVPDLSFLSNFPVFGEYGKRVVYDIGLDTGKEMEIDIKTLPPSGVLFSNGVRKKCFITSKECQYFDPKNGVPYSDVEAYKVIQELQNPLGDGNEENPNPHFQWFGFKNGGVYLNALQRPAKGVPEGF